MTFKRIDDDTINCIITSEDLDERGLSAEDIFHKKEEASVFLKEVIDQAQREVDYHPAGAYVTMQIALLPDQSISLTLSENQETSIAGALRSLAERLQQFVEQLHEKQLEAAGNENKASVEEAFVYAFDSVRSAVRFASTTPAIMGESSLYKDAETGEVLLLMRYVNDSGVVLEIGGRQVDANRKSFYRMIAHASEYGRFVTGDPRHVMRMCERCDKLIGSDALERLSAL